MFLLFSTNFQSFSKTILLFGTRFYYFLRFSTNFQSFGNTLERTRETQCSPWAWRAARLTGIGRLRWRPWPGKGWGKTRGLPTAICGRGWVEERRQLAGRRRTVSTVATGSVPASFQPGTNRGRHREVVGGLGRLRNALACGDIGRSGGSSVGRAGSATGMSCGVREGHGERSFIGRAQRRDTGFNVVVRRPSCLACT
jgi:hypothetical protein